MLQLRILETALPRQWRYSYPYLWPQNYTVCDLLLCLWLCHLREVMHLLCSHVSVLLMQDDHETSQYLRQLIDLSPDNFGKPFCFLTQHQVSVSTVRCTPSIQLL